jgi:hypothetical protein
LEHLDLRDFIDIVYTYSINSPDMRHAFRSSMLQYAFDFKEAGQDDEDTPTFEGFKGKALSMADLLDLPPDQWDLQDESSVTYKDDRPVS